jgi:hypothetical protein
MFFNQDLDKKLLVWRRFIKGAKKGFGHIQKDILKEY